ncbi:MAG: PadR family transcriptional regulator [Planctomycetota bacterium]
MPARRKTSPAKLDAELMRGVASTAVLSLLAQREQYGYELVQAIAEQSGGLIRIGQSTVYPLLYNLESKGHVESVWRDGDAGRPRKYYRLTRKGRRRLSASQTQWRAVVDGMSRLGVLGQALAGSGVAAGRLR